MDTLKQRLLAAAQGVQLGADGMGWSIDAELINEAAKMVAELERENTQLRECCKALSEALAFEFGKALRER